MLGVELLEDISLELEVLADSVDDLLALLMRRGFDEIGDLGRVQASKFAVRDAEHRRRHMGDERLDALPIDDGLRRDALGEHAGEHPAQNRPAGRVDPDHLEGAVDQRDLDLVRTDEPGAHDVDQVPSRQVFGEEKLAGPSFETGEIERLALELDASGANASDQRDRHEELPPADSRDDPGHRGMCLFALARDDVLDPAHPFPVTAQQRAVDDAGKMDDVGGHQTEAKRDRHMAIRTAS